MRSDKIVIVGGGSAGWMTAATLIRAFPNKDISVIESPNVPSIGVGESTLGQFRRWTRFIGLDENDFIPYADATYKLSIQFTDFFNKDSGSFHYPFGYPYIENEEDRVFPTWYAMRELMPDLPETSLVDMLFPGQKLWSTNKYYENEDGRLGNFSHKFGFVSYHFDAVKFANWLRERYCIPNGVKHIPKHVEHIEVNDNGVEYLLMDDGEKIYADLFFDCTGFRSLLMAGALEEPFISYSDMLPNNSAWACQIPYKDKYLELQPYTNCTAIENGWCWNIPLWSRIGTGYNYSDKYVSDEDALEEFKNYLCSDKMTIPRTREEVDTYKFRNLKTRVGIHERTFVKNVVAIGLSAGFIEPLESNGLYSVHEFLFHLIKFLARPEISEFDKRMYNNEVLQMFDGFAKFVAMHYCMSNRTDTRYWTDIMEWVYKEDPISLFSNAFYMAQRKFIDVWDDDWNLLDGVLYISAGMQYRPMFGADIVDQQEQDPNFKDKVLNVYKHWKEREKAWEDVAKEAPHMVDYMRKHFYSE